MNPVLQVFLNSVLSLLVAGTTTALFNVLAERRKRFHGEQAKAAAETHGLAVELRREAQALMANLDHVMAGSTDWEAPLVRFYTLKEKYESSYQKNAIYFDDATEAQCERLAALTVEAAKYVHFSAKEMCRDPFPYEPVQEPVRTAAEIDGDISAVGTNLKVALRAIATKGSAPSVRALAKK